MNWVGEWKYRVPFFHAKVRGYQKHWGRERGGKADFELFESGSIMALDYDALALRLQRHQHSDESPVEFRKPST